MIKLTYVLFARDGLELAAARHLWLEEHGAMMRRHASLLRVARYVQTPRVVHPLEAVMARTRGLDVPLPLGMAEIYWATQADLEFSFADPVARSAWRELVTDEGRFAKAQQPPWIGEERVVISGGAEHVG